MQGPTRFSPEIPWVVVLQNGAMFRVACDVCGADALLPHAGAVQAFAGAHAAHRAASGFGLGDAVAAVAKPAARLLGKAPCTPCEERRQALNRYRLW